MCQESMRLYIGTPFMHCKAYIHISSFIGTSHSPKSTLSSLYLETIELCILSLLMKEGNFPKGHTMSTRQISWNSKLSLLASPSFTWHFLKALMKLSSLAPIQWCPGEQFTPRSKLQVLLTGTNCLSYNFQDLSHKTKCDWERGIDLWAGGPAILHVNLCLRSPIPVEDVASAVLTLTLCETAPSVPGTSPKSSPSTAPSVPGTSPKSSPSWRWFRC